MTDHTVPVPVNHLRAIQKWRNGRPASQGATAFDAATAFIAAMDLPEPWEPSDEMVQAAAGIGGCSGSHTATLLKRLHAAGFDLTLREAK